jgi:uracil-DNA glycosylase
MNREFEHTPFNLEELMKDIKPSWLKLFKEIKNENPELFNKLESKLNKDLEQFHDSLLIFPPRQNIFEAFKYFELEDTKVCINGQDPYHQYGQAHGLSFSVKNGVKLPPSLNNIFKELKNQYPEFKNENGNGNLTEWAKQGVLMLNSALTVLENSANEYQDYWTPITNILMKKMSDRHPGKCVYMLWGNDAKKYKKNGSIDCNKHYILEATHPSPLSANRGGWFGNNHFILVNEYLKKNHNTEIKWILEND